MSRNMLSTIKVRFIFAGYIFVQILLSYMQMKIILVHQETSKQKGGLHYLYAFKWPFQYISHFMRKPTIWSKFSICTFLFKNCFHVLRVYQTLIKWLRSLSADVMISPTSSPLPRRLVKYYFDVMRYTTFSREIRLTLYKTSYFSTILQQNLIFFL